jgi:hypothetical protein
VDQLLALAGWIPPLTAAQASRFTEAAIGAASREQFVAMLRDDTELNVWAEGFLAHTQPSENPSSEQIGQPSLLQTPLLPLPWRRLQAATRAATSSPAGHRQARMT